MAALATAGSSSLSSVLIPAAFVVSLIPRFFPVPREPAGGVEYVDRGEVVRYSGTDFQLTDLEVLDGDVV